MMWYYARVRWAVMAEGRGLRQWKESMFLFQSVDREAAFQRALDSYPFIVEHNESHIL